MGRMSCEEWMAWLRHSVSGGPSRRFVGDPVPGRRVGVDGPQLVTVGEFHRECVRVAVGLKVRPDRFQSR